MHFRDEHLADQPLQVLPQGLSSDDLGLLGLELDVCIVIVVSVVLLVLKLLGVVGGCIFDVFILSFVGVHFS